MEHHFNNYISFKKARELADSDVKKITITPTAKNQTRRRTLEYLNKQGIELELYNKRGRPKKLSQKKIKILLAMKKSSEMSFYKVADSIKVPKSTVFDYYHRFKNTPLNQDEVDGLQVDAAHKVLRMVLSRNPGGEMEKLALRGLKTRDIEELQYILREIEEIMELYRE